MEKDFARFVEDLKAPDTFRAWGSALALLKVGNFDGLVAFARDRGYTFTAADVKAFLETWRGGGGEPRAAGRPNDHLVAWARH